MDVIQSAIKLTVDRIKIEFLIALYTLLMLFNNIGIGMFIINLTYVFIIYLK
jgi:hypothetical protein